ncbi:MAG: hypothetical protein WCC04_08175 [Terriglobales bacterium]
MANNPLKHFLRIAVIGAIFGAVGTPVAATLFFAAYCAVSGGGFSIGMIYSFLLLSSVIAVPVGLMYGLIDGIWLSIAGWYCRSRLALTIHGALAGFLLGLLPTLSGWLFHTDNPEWKTNTVFFATVGSCVGAAGAALFGRLLMKPSSPG